VIMALSPHPFRSIFNHLRSSQSFVEFYGCFEAMALTLRLGFSNGRGSDGRSHSAGDGLRWIAEVRFRDLS
jgi:hypothetical protein